MTLGVAREFATQGIRALSISPGSIKTPFQGAAQSSHVKQFLNDVQKRRAEVGRRTTLRQLTTLPRH